MLSGVFMKILFISGESSFYTRNAVILKGLRENNVDVIECTSSAKSYFLRYLISIYKYYEKEPDTDYSGTIAAVMQQQSQIRRLWKF